MKKLTCFAVLLACWACSFGQVDAQIFAPGDDIWGIQVVDPDVIVGVEGFAGDTNNWPGGESPDHAIDGVGQKYLNFGKVNTGILVTPSVGSTVAISMTLWTANDAVERDPSGYQLFGTNVAIAGGGPFLLADFTEIASGDLALPASRNDGGDAALLPENSQTVGFANSDAYSSYLVVFPDVADNGAANSMQIAEVQLWAIPEPTSVAMVCMGLAALGFVRRRK